MFCSNCGKEIPDGVKFCPYCGSPTVPGVMTTTGNGGVAVVDESEDMLMHLNSMLPALHDMEEILARVGYFESRSLAGQLKTSLRIVSGGGIFNKEEFDNNRKYLKQEHAKGNWLAGTMLDKNTLFAHSSKKKEEQNLCDYAQEHADVLKYLPYEYWSSNCVNYMIKLVNDGRAQTRKELLNVFDEIVHRENMEQAMMNMQSELEELKWENAMNTFAIICKQ